MDSKPLFIKSDIKVSVGILVSNNIRYIRKCLESVKPLLEAVPSELIIVDTVGEEKSDGSLAVAREFTDRIFHFDWINDFSAARNVALNNACGEWFLYYDDDEIFDDVTEIIDFFKNGECNHYNFAQIYSGDYYNKTQFNKHVIGRMIKRTPETKFIGIVHECFNKVYGPIKQFDVFTHHYGYLFETEEQKRKKVQRNLPLLEKQLEIGGMDSRFCAQIIQEIMLVDPEAAARRSLVFIEDLKKENKLWDTGGQFILLANFRYMAGWTSLDILLSLYRELQERYDLRELTCLVLYQIIVSVAFVQRRFNEVSEYADRYLKVYDWLMAHEEERLEQANFDLNDFMEREKYATVVSNAVISRTILEKYREAYDCFRRLDLNCCGDMSNVKDAVLFSLRELKDQELIRDYYSRFYKDEFMRDPVLEKYISTRI